MIANVGALTGGVLFGLYSDRIGRRRAITIALAGAIVMIPAWAFAPSLPVLFLGAFAMQFMVQGAWGVIPAHITELSPDAVRGFLPGFAYQCGVAVAAYVPTFQARLAARVTYTVAMPLTAGIAFAVCAIVAWLGPERRGITYGAASPLPRA